MKKVFVAVVVMIATVTMSSAQVFVGGGLGLDFSGGKEKGGSASIDKPTGLAVQFTPKVGFHLNDDFAVGLEVGITSLSLKEAKTDKKDETKNSMFIWEISGFARYKLVGYDRLSLLLEGSIGIAGGKAKTKVGSTTNEGDPVTIFSIGALPVLSYNLTDKLSIEASCDFLRLGFSATTITDSDDSNYKDITTNFGLGVNSQTVSLSKYGGASFSNYFNVGLIFKF